MVDTLAGAGLRSVVGVNAFLWLTLRCWKMQMERDSAREATRAARDAFTQCRAAYDERAAPLKKLREQGQDAAANANKLKASFR